MRSTCEAPPTDSRCPPDVECVAAGRLVVETLVTRPDFAQPRVQVFEAPLDPGSTRFTVRDVVERDGLSVAVFGTR